MNSTNIVILSGRVSADPEVKAAPYDSSQKIVRFTLITHRSWTDRTGATKDSIMYHRIVIKNPRLTELSQYIKSGTHLILTGSIDQRDPKYPPEVVVKDLTLGPRANKTTHNPVEIDDSINMIMLGGYIGDNPEQVQLESGVALVKFSLATQRRTKENDAWVEKPVWHKIYALGDKLLKQAMALRKGDYCIAIGEISIRKKDEQRVFEVKANKITTAPRPQEGEDREAISVPGEDFDDMMIPFDDSLPMTND